MIIKTSDTPTAVYGHGPEGLFSYPGMGGRREVTKPGGKSPGRSIKNPKVYEALKKRGYSKAQAASISNSMVKKESTMSDRVTEILIEKGYTEREIEKAKGGFGQWIRDKIGRFASKPGGGGGGSAGASRRSGGAGPRGGETTTSLMTATRKATPGKTTDKRIDAVGKKAEKTYMIRVDQRRGDKHGNRTLIAARHPAQANQVAHDTMSYLGYSQTKRTRNNQGQTENAWTNQHGQTAWYASGTNSASTMISWEL